MQPDLVWCEVHLDEVAGVLDGYRLWKNSAWAEAVNWWLVCDELATVLQNHAINGAVPDLASRLAPKMLRLSHRDQMGLRSLVSEPITVTRAQLLNGGHRLHVMRHQGVRVVPGLFVRGDLGVSVDASRVYPVRR